MHEKQVTLDPAVHKYYIIMYMYHETGQNKSVLPSEEPVLLLEEVVWESAIKAKHEHFASR